MRDGFDCHINGKFLLIAPAICLPLLYFQTSTFSGISFENILKIFCALSILVICNFHLRIRFTILEFLLLLMVLKPFLIYTDDFDIRSIIVSSCLSLCMYIAYSAGTLQPFKGEILIGRIAVVFSLYYLAFKIGIFESNTLGFDMSIYGGSGFSQTANFSRPHIFGITYGVMLIVLLHDAIFRTDYRLNLILKLILCLICLMAVYDSFTRTAWVMSASGIIVLILRHRYRWILLLGACLLAVFVTVFWSASGWDVIANRIFDYYGDVSISDSDRIGSGRIIFITEYITIFKSFSMLEMVMGIGEAKAKYLMEGAIGRSLEAHNGAVDALVQQGLLGLLLQFSVILVLAYTSLSPKASAVLQSLFVCYIVIFLLQGGTFFFLDFIMFFAAGAASSIWDYNAEKI